MYQGIRDYMAQRMREGLRKFEEERSARIGRKCSKGWCLVLAEYRGVKTKKLWCQDHSFGKAVEELDICCKIGCDLIAEVRNKRTKSIYCAGHAKGVCEPLKA